MVGEEAHRPDQEEPQGCAWASLERDYLLKLIMEQIPRFKSRPYVADERALQLALRLGLAHRLKGDFCWSPPPPFPTLARHPLPPTSTPVSVSETFTQLTKASCPHQLSSQT